MRRIEVGFYFLLTFQVPIFNCNQRLNGELKSSPSREGSPDDLTLLRLEISALKNQVSDLNAAMKERHLPLDCSSAQKRGDWRVKVEIKAPGLPARVVRCEQFLEGGGWTVGVYRSSAHLFPRGKRSVSYRQPTNYLVRKTRERYATPKWSHRAKIQMVDEVMAIDFNRTWNEYKEGFGDPEEEYWIGNEVLRALTQDREWEAMVLIEDWSGRRGHGFWNFFRVQEEANKYKLEISGYDPKRSTLGDGFAYHNGRAFSTFDSDNEKYRDHCAQKLGGGWWFHQCHVSYLTGVHLRPGEEGHHAVQWIPWRNTTESLKSAMLMIRPPKPTSL